MFNTADLSIEVDILPLFDYTKNKFAKTRLEQLLDTPLKSVGDIYHRQSIIKALAESGIDENINNYYSVELYEVYEFLTNPAENADIVKSRHRSIRLRFSQDEKQQLISKFIQTILLLNRLFDSYSGIQFDRFPIYYQVSLRFMFDFMLRFTPSTIVSEIRAEKISTKRLVKFIEQTELLAKIGETKKFWDILFEFEAYLSLGIAVKRKNLSFPTFNPHRFHVCQLYYPALKSPVKNDIEVKSSVVLLTGPNMSGKSTLLKSISVCVVLAHLGMAVPASMCEIPFFDSISICLRHTDDIKSGYSQFMRELNRLKSILLDIRENKRCFAIFDELFTATNVDDSLDISAEVVEGLSKAKGSYTLISTHLQQLINTVNKSADEIDFFYIDCKLYNGQLSFPYKLKPGWSNLRLGRFLFDAEGLKELLDIHGKTKNLL